MTLKATTDKQDVTFNSNHLYEVDTTRDRVRNSGC